jgi:putative membrane protein
MIRNFGDHAANERTFLAWVRTAIAVMAFGFLVEKFDLFLALISIQGHGASLHGSGIGNLTGLALLGLGVAMITIAAIRFTLTSRYIDSEQVHLGTGSRFDIGLAVLLVLLGCILAIYMSHAFVTKL